MPLFVVCVPAAGATESVAPCSDVGGVHYVATVQELAAPGSINFDNSNQLFAYGFEALLVIWLLGLVVGAIISLIDNRT